MLFPQELPSKISATEILFKVNAPLLNFTEKKSKNSTYGYTAHSSTILTIRAQGFLSVERPSPPAC